MREINQKKWYSPREIAEDGMLVGIEGKAKYWTVLRMIRQGKLEATILNPDSSTPYKLISETEIERYNSEVNKRFS